MMATLILLIAAKSMTSCAGRIKFSPSVIPQPGRMMQQRPMNSARLNSMQVLKRDVPFWLSNAEEAKGAWHAKLNDPTWGTFAAAMTTVPSAVGQDVQVTKQPDMVVWTKAANTLVDIARREEAETGRPAHLDAVSWDAVVAAVLEVQRSKVPDDKAAKRVQLAQRAIDKFKNKDSRRADQKQAARDAWVEGNDAAKESKDVWLERMDASTWAVVAEAVGAVASVVNEAGADGLKPGRKAGTTAASDDARIKAGGLGRKGYTADGQRAFWVARVDAATWTKAASAINMIASWDAVTAAVLEVASGDQLSKNKVADHTSFDKTFLAQQAIATFSKKDTHVMDVWPEDCDASTQTLLARMDSTTWEAVAEAVGAVCGAVTSGSANEETAAAKKAWLARVGVATWAKAAFSIRIIAREEKAKAEWLSDIAEAIAPAVATSVLAPGAMPAFEGDARAGEQIFLGNHDMSACPLPEQVTNDKNAVPPFCLSEEDIKNVATYVISLAKEDWD